MTQNENVEWLKNNKNLFDKQFFDKKGMYVVEYETRKTLFIEYEKIVLSEKFKQILQHPYSQKILESTNDKNFIACLLFRQGQNPVLYQLLTPI